MIPVRDEIREATFDTSLDRRSNPGNAGGYRGNGNARVPKFPSFHVTPPIRPSLRDDWHRTCVD